MRDLKVLIGLINVKDTQRLLHMVLYKQVQGPHIDDAIKAPAGQPKTQLCGITKWFLNYLSTLILI